MMILSRLIFYLYFLNIGKLIAFEGFLSDSFHAESTLISTASSIYIHE